MNYKQYADYVWDIFNPSIRDGDPDKRTLYLVSKLINEIIEFCQNPSLDEAGDINWYLTNLDNIYQIDFQSVIMLFPEIPSVSEYSFLIQANQLFDQVLKYNYHGKPFDQSKFHSNLMFTMYYFNYMLKRFNLTWEQVWQHNCNKLQERHGKNYNAGFYQK